MRYFAFTLLILLLPNCTWAADCGTVNLILEKNSPFLRIPVYNQEKINICYAYTAAQMTDYLLIKNGAPERNVHPVWPALHYALRKGKRNLEIGHTKEALEALRFAGNCDYEAVAQALREAASTPNESEPKILGSIKKSNSEAPVDIIKKLIDPGCRTGKRKAVPLPPVKMYNFKQLPEDRAYEEFVMVRLSSSPYPLSISYCSNIWRDPRYAGLTLNSHNVRDRLLKGCKYHESLIVGKKLIGGSCHFLVRNTWGTNWTKDNRELTCLCRNKRTGEFIEECDFRSHREGYSVEACWLRSGALARNIGQVTFFDWPVLIKESSALFRKR